MFWQLNRGRAYASSMGGTFPLGLGYSDVAMCGMVNGFHDADLQEYVEIIYTMDAAYMEAVAEKRKLAGTT